MFVVLLGVGILLVILGNLLSQTDLVPLQMTYGNFDVSGRISFINRLLPGTFDHASSKEYLFQNIRWHPFIVLVGFLFPFLLFWALFRNREYWRDGINRVWFQYSSFIISRLGVFRASEIYPIRRSCMGTFPFLNCQACEMATGACPVGVLQNLVSQGIWPIYLAGSMILFGIVLGKTICGWLCPFGFVSDLIDRLSLHLYKMPRKLSLVRYWVLGITIGGAILYLFMGIHDRNFFCSTICVSGKILGIFPYYFSTARDSFFPIDRWLTDFWGTGFLVSFHTALTLLALVAMLLISGRMLCRVLCPLDG